MSIRSKSAFAVLAIFSLAGCSKGAHQATGDNPAGRQSAEAPLTRLSQDSELGWAPCPEIFPPGCEIAVLHGDPSGSDADVFLRIGGGYQLPAHSHSSAERMILVSGELNVHYQGAVATTLTEGEYAYGPAGLPHVGACVSSEPCTLFIAFDGPIDALPFSGSIE